MPESRPRRWPLRVLQFSPLVAIALMALVWFSIPPILATLLANTGVAPEGETVTRIMRARLLDSVSENDEAIALGLTGAGGSFESVTEDAWMNWIYSLGPNPSKASVFATAALSAQATEFAPIAEWERTHDARVWAWVVPRPAQPRLFASATPNAAALTRVQAQAQQLNASLGGDYSTPADYLSYLWNNGQEISAAPSLELQLMQVGTSGGTGSDDMSIGNYVLQGGGGLYPTFVASTVDPYAMERIPTLEELVPLDPTSRSFKSEIARIAKAHNANIWVFGPMDFEARPLRLPAGASAQDAAVLGSAVWPSMAIWPPDSAAPPVRPLPAPVAGLAGGPAASIQVTGVNNTAYFTSAPTGQVATDSVSPQTVAFLAVWSKAPASTPPFEVAWRRWQRFVAEWFPLLLGGAVALLGLTLVASPAAFVYERRLVAREQVRDEMARMRRDVHDKVYNRLSALSKRVAVSGSDQSASNAVALVQIAEDIRSTVGELQEILGDEARHTNGALTSVPLAEQIASVCAAQSARLGVEIDCSADDGLPDADARLGWDVQCIAEEAITNAVRHGGAKHVRVRLVLADEMLELTVSDDGGGSAVLSADDAPEGSTGLRGIAERLARHDGELRMTTGGGGGTVLVARVPMTSR